MITIGLLAAGCFGGSQVNEEVTAPLRSPHPTFTPTLTDAPDLFDVQEAACVSGACPAGQACGSDNMCYRPALEKIQLGFTGSQRTSDQLVNIKDLFTTWLP